MPDIQGSFRKQGLRFTPQRYAVLDYLRKHPCHPTAEEVYEAVNRRHPRASLATVYKSLHALTQAGLIREVNLAGNATRFESVTGPHHHFVCQSCGRLEDVPWFDLPGLAKKAKAAPRAVRTWELVLRGLCESCQSRIQGEATWEK